MLSISIEMLAKVSSGRVEENVKSILKQWIPNLESDFLPINGLKLFSMVPIIAFPSYENRKQCRKY